MNRLLASRTLLAALASAGLLWAQVPLIRPPVQRAPAAQPPQQSQPAQTQPAQPQQQSQPAQAQPAQSQTTPAQAAPGRPNAAAPAPTTQPPAGQAAGAAPAPLADNGAFLVPGASLSEMIDILAKRLRINIIIDPRVKGTVTLYTYGEVRPVDYMQLLQTILRVNSASMVKVGDLYRIVPIASVSQLPLEPLTNVDPKNLPDDDRMVLDLIFLKYATAAELEKLIEPFLGEGASHSVYEPANLIILEDNARSMRRTLELISLFDSDTFAGQRVRLFDVSHSRPSDLVKELQSVFKAYAMSDKSPVQFVAVDRINTVIAVAPNPGIFTQVESWIKKLDVSVKSPAGEMNNYVYRLKYGQASTVAMAIMALYTGNTTALMAMSSMMNAGMVSAGMGYGGMPGGMGFGGGTGFGGMGYGGMGYGGMGYGGIGGLGYPGAMGGMYGGYNAGAYGYGAGAYGYGGGYAGAQPPVPLSTSAPGTTPGATAGTNQTGSYLSGSTAQQNPALANMPHVVPNPFGNTLLIQATPEQYDQILNLLQQLDVAPRQVLIDAKIYEVDLTNDLSAGVESYLQKAGSANPSAVSAGRVLTAAAGGAPGLGVSAGLLVLRSHELLGALTANDSRFKARVISSPSIIATDSIPATMNVGSQVPTLSSVASTGFQTGGTSVFANNIANVGTGTTLSILASVNSSGIVTMVINQQVSAPQAPAQGAAIQSPSFSNRSLSTQMTVQDGDTVAIGGIIQENHSETSSGVPFLNRIPILGAAFGSKAVHTDRTELIVFLTPRVIYDTNQLVDATDELKSNLKRVGKLMRDEE